MITSSQKLYSLYLNMEYICCNHQERIFVKTQCSGYRKYVSPCCVHRNTGEIILTCYSTKLCHLLLLILNLFIFLSGSMTLIWVVSQLNELLSPFIQLSTVNMIICFAIYWLERVPKRYLGAAVALGYILEFLAAILFKVHIGKVSCGLMVGTVALNELEKILKKRGRYSPLKVSRRRLNELHGLFFFDRFCCCCDEFSNYYILPCRHACYCKTCVASLMKCASCRGRID